MRVSEAWLKEWVDTGKSATELADCLTMAGLEVDAIEPAAPPFSGVVVGHVTAVEPHPDADKLTVCSVDDGSGASLAVVCGAPNVHVGVAGAFGIAILALTYPAFAIPFRLIELPFSALLSTLRPHLVIGAVMAATVSVVRMVLEASGAGAPIVLALGVAAGCLVYGSLLWALRPIALTDLLDVILPVAGERRTLRSLGPRPVPREAGGHVGN
jgi:hypothetical protein